MVRLGHIGYGVALCIPQGYATAGNRGYVLDHGSRSSSLLCRAADTSDSRRHEVRRTNQVPLPAFGFCKEGRDLPIPGASSEVFAGT